MANVDVVPAQFVDKRRVAGTTTALVGTPANYSSVGAKRARLAAANPTYYTSARLDDMTDNDMTYALRTIDDAAGI